MLNEFGGNHTISNIVLIELLWISCNADIGMTLESATSRGRMFFYNFLYYHLAFNEQLIIVTGLLLICSRISMFNMSD